MKPGEVYDKNGTPIYPGDLLRSFHFRDRTHKGKIRYLYHVAVLYRDRMDAVPVSHLEPSKVSDGGRCWLTNETAGTMEVIFGYGPGDLMHDERPRKNPQRLLTPADS